MGGAAGKRLWTAAGAARERGRLRGVIQPARVLGLTELAREQAGAVSRTQLEAHLGAAGLRRAVRAGTWRPVHRGAYAHRDEPRSLHALQCAAQVLLSDRDLVVSHRSAAVLHGLPLLGPPGPPQLTVVRPHGAPPAHERVPLTSAVPLRHRTVLRGLPVTTLPRTVADLARTSSREVAVATADAALRAGVDRVDVLEVLDDCHGWPGAGAAVDALVLATSQAESPLESLARVWFSRAGLPPPQLQVRLCHGDDGRFVARVDFLWPQHRTVCEVDGRVKYTDGSVLWQEKLREDTLRELGLEVVRGYWSDRPQHGRALVDRLARAFARGARRTDPPSYGVLSR